MSIRDLQTFLAIVETGSFVGAARTMYRTQSAITAQIQGLEDRIGTKLFDRTTRPPTLTSAGHHFLERATDVVTRYNQLFDHTNPQIHGNLRLGVVPSIITGLVPRALVLLRTRHPALLVELSMGLSAELVGQVRRNELDAALISDPLEPRLGVRWSPFMREPLVLIAPSDVPTLGAQALLNAYPYIRYSRKAWVGGLIERVLRQKRLMVRETMVLDTLEATLSMVHAGLGVSIVPMLLVEPLRSLPVRSVALPGAVVYRRLGLVEPMDHTKSELSSTLLSVFQSIAVQVGGAIPHGSPHKDD